MYEIVCVGLAMVAPCTHVADDFTKGPFHVGDVNIIGNCITPQEEIVEPLSVFPGQRMSRFELWKAESRLRQRFAKSPYFSRGKGPRVGIEDENAKAEFKSIKVEFPEQMRAGDSK